MKGCKGRGRTLIKRDTTVFSCGVWKSI